MKIATNPVFISIYGCAAFHDIMANCDILVFAKAS